MSSTTTLRSRSTHTLSDLEWLKSLSMAVVEAGPWQAVLRKGNVSSVAKHLRKRLLPFAESRLLETLRWSCESQVDSLTIDALEELIHLQRRKGRQAVELTSGMIEAWLDRQADTTVPSLPDQLLASIVLAELSHSLSDGVLVRLWRFVEERTGQSVRSVSTIHAAVHEVLHLEQQLWRLLASSPQAPRKVDLGPVAQGIREFLGQYTDEAGAPAAEIQSSLAVLTASLLRLQSVASTFDLSFCGKKDLRRIRDLVRLALLMTPIEATWVPSRTPHEALDWMKRVAAEFDLSSDEAISRQLRCWTRVSLGKGLSKVNDSPTSRPALKKKQLISHESDASKYAFMHGDWRESRDRCLVRFDQSIPHIEASVLEIPVLQGAWSARVIVGGQVWTEGEWACCCWFSDSDADYCELKWEPVEGVTVYRQLLWARRDRFLMVADEVRAPGQKGIQFHSQLPLSAGWQPLASGRTREWQLHQNSQAVRVYPIFQMQDRLQKTDGKLECTAQSIQTHLASPCDGAYSAIIIDWDRSRRSTPVQWSPLTVVEDRQRLAPHVACGARWKIGDSLWMIYHQLSRGDSARSVMGLHTHHETVVTRVKDGDYDRLVEVEA